MSILVLLDLEKSFLCVVWPDRHIAFYVQQLFCFLAVSWIDEMYVYVCNVDANINNNNNNKKTYIFWAQQILNS